MKRGQEASTTTTSTKMEERSIRIVLKVMYIVCHYLCECWELILIMEESDVPPLPFVGSGEQDGEVNGEEVVDHNQEQRRKYSRRRDNNTEDPNGWYKHRRKRNKRIRSGKNQQGGDEPVESMVEVHYEQFPHLISSATQVTNDSIPSADENLSTTISMDDLKYIVYHLGYTPHNLMAVAHYHMEETSSPSTTTSDSNNTEPPSISREKRPAVLQLYPLNPYTHNNYVNRYDKNTRPFQHRKGETLFPFPTLFWMLSPSINTAVAALEEEGWIPRLTDRLRANPDYVAQMESAHRAYANERWQYLTPEHRQYVDEKKW